jgi:hypothetical protein
MLVADEPAFPAAPDSAEEIRKAIGVITRAKVSDADTARVRGHLAVGGWPPATPDRD